MLASLPTTRDECAQVLRTLCRISPRWWLDRTSAIEPRFLRRACVRLGPDKEGLDRVTINGVAYIWPRNSPLRDLLSIACEMTSDRHPHRYLWGRTHIGAGDVVMDIGACEGSFAALAAERGARVIAVEPSQLMQRVVRRLFAVRGLADPEVIQCALGRDTGTLHFHPNANRPGLSQLTATPAPDSYPVPVLPLDTLVASLELNRLDFVKCDAEGADVDILMSGPRALERFRPRIAVCTYHADDHCARLESFLRSLGYRTQAKGLLRLKKRVRVMMLHAW